MNTIIKNIQKQLLPRIYRYSISSLLEAWGEAPFGKNPRVLADGYLSMWNTAKACKVSCLDVIEVKTGFSIDKEWLDSLGLITQVVKKKSESFYQYGRLLYSLVCKRVSDLPGVSITILETGTARGFSALCMSCALFDRGASGRVITVDILPHLRKMYWNCIADSEGMRSREELLAGYQHLLERILFVQGDSFVDLARLGLPRVHFAFLDGVHNKKYISKEFTYVNARQSSGDLIVFDDYDTCSPGLIATVDSLADKYGYILEIVNLTPSRTMAIGVKA
jgi:predicted O-methyltransferase YrrM